MVGTALGGAIVDSTVIAAIISVLGVGFLGMLGYFLQGIRSELRALRTEIGGLREEVHQIDIRLVRVEEQVRQIDTRLGRVEEQVRQQGHQIDRIETRLVRVEELVGEGTAAPVPA